MKNPRLISSLNSKKCLRASSAAPKKGLIAILLFAWAGSYASNQLTQSNSNLNITKRIQSDIAIQQQKGGSFDTLTKQWEKAYGYHAYQPLLEIAANSHISEMERYIAMMSASKLGGTAAIPSLIVLLRDSSWMIRSGALRALSVVGDSRTGEAVLPLAHDPALTVRVEAVEAIRKLKPKGTTEALLFIIEDKNNYHAGKAQWAPQKALLALTSLHAKEAVPRLKPLLASVSRNRDPEFKKELERALNLLEGSETF